MLLFHTIDELIKIKNVAIEFDSRGSVSSSYYKILNYS